MISKMQGPIYPGGLSICKSERLGRDVLIGDDVLHWFDCLRIACQLPMDLVHPLSRIA